MKITQTIPSAEMDTLVQAALDDPRPGDIFHEMYSYGVQVLDVTDTHVEWRSFGRAEIDRGTKTREQWSLAFRYGDHMPGMHTMHLLERGTDRVTAPDLTPEQRETLVEVIRLQLGNYTLPANVACYIDGRSGIGEASREVATRCAPFIANALVPAVARMLADARAEAAQAVEEVISETGLVYSKPGTASQLRRALARVRGGDRS